MHNSQWKCLRRSLAQGGVPFWRIGRAVAEMQDHYADLVEEARDAGLNREEARRDAACRLGDLEQLAVVYTNQAELSGWSGRYAMAQVCVADGLEILGNQSGPAKRWLLSLLAAATLTTTFLFVLKITIFGF
jgi:hypothetical protein